MPHFVVTKIQDALNERGKPLNGSRIHILGVAYKRDIDDVRESPALDIMHLLMKRGAKVGYSDSHVPSLTVDGVELKSGKLNGEIDGSDCVVIITDHTGLDYESIVRRASVVVDTRNALRGIESENIIRL